mmetsp:Transcript_68406/g.178086  ORF Transcript_68406/g.178086 Transcript_68406/m.178086 type:complete len:225 (-) Transcript_68406:529-1203(-)
MRRAAARGHTACPLQEGAAPRHERAHGGPRRVRLRHTRWPGVRARRPPFLQEHVRHFWPFEERVQHRRRGLHKFAGVQQGPLQHSRHVCVPAGRERGGLRGLEGEPLHRLPPVPGGRHGLRPPVPRGERVARERQAADEPCGGACVCRQQEQWRALCRQPPQPWCYQRHSSHAASPRARRAAALARLLAVERAAAAPGGQGRAGSRCRRCLPRRQPRRAALRDR